MARGSNRDTAAKRNPRRVDPASRQERVREAIRQYTRKMNNEEMIDQVSKFAGFWCLLYLWKGKHDLSRDTRIALRRKLNGDTR